MRAFSMLGMRLQGVGRVGSGITMVMDPSENQTVLNFSR